LPDEFSARQLFQKDEIEFVDDPGVELELFLEQSRARGGHHPIGPVKRRRVGAVEVVTPPWRRSRKIKQRIHIRCPYPVRDRAVALSLVGGTAVGALR